MDSIILDVREKDEYNSEYIEGSVWIPLSHLNELAPAFLQENIGKKLTIMCRSGMRAKMAQAQIAKMGFGDQITTGVYKGGILAWKKQGKPTIAQKKAHFPIMRQVQLIAGLGVLTFSILSIKVDTRFAWGAAFFGAGLTLAGSTGFCALAELLALMPWNKSK